MRMEAGDETTEPATVVLVELEDDVIGLCCCVSDGLLAESALPRRRRVRRRCMAGTGSEERMRIN